MEKVIIAAVSDNGIIGSNNSIPWHFGEDLRHFKKLTIGYPVIMGRKTYESIGGPLDKRVNIVVTKKGGDYDNRIIICHSIDEALSKAEEYSKRAYVIGGGEIYKQTFDLADYLEITEIHRYAEGDTSFPKIGWEWKETNREDFFDFSFVSYKRAGI